MPAENIILDATFITSDAKFIVFIRRTPVITRWIRTPAEKLVVWVRLDELVVAELRTKTKFSSK